MRLFLALLFTASTLLACQNSCNKARSSTLLDTLDYALIVMDLQDDADINTAIALYKRDMKALSRQFDTEAFKEGKFNPDTYRANHVSSQKIDAQIALFETLYLILTDAQKKRLHQLMSAHIHYIDVVAKEAPKACHKGCGKSCAHKMKGSCE